MKHEVSVVMKTSTALFWYLAVCCVMEGHLPAGNHLTDWSTVTGIWRML